MTETQGLDTHRPDQKPSQAVQKGQISHPPNPGSYFTRPPWVCQDSLFAQRRGVPRARPQQATGDCHLSGWWLSPSASGTGTG